jgi:hypothetical protein
MEDYLVRLVVPAIALVSGLIATYVSLQNRALLAEVRKEMADLENRLVSKINGTYIRRRECELRTANVQQQIDTLATEVRRNAG